MGAVMVPKVEEGKRLVVIYEVIDPLKAVNCVCAVIVFAPFCKFKAGCKFVSVVGFADDPKNPFEIVVTFTDVIG
jgi:hypothetical protein